MKIAVPWPVQTDYQPRIRVSLRLWEDKDLLAICLAEESDDPFLEEFCTLQMPRNSTDIGAKFGRCYIYDMLSAIRKKFPEEDWYGICNSDCVPVGDITENHTEYNVLIYHRTDVPQWQYRLNADRNKESLPKPILDQIWEMRQSGLTDKKIARKLNRLEVKPPSDSPEWTYLLLRDLFFEQGTVFFWGQDMFLFRADVVDKVLDEYLKVRDPIIGGGFDERLTKWCLDNTQAARIINKVFHRAHTSEWTTDDVEYKHNGGDLSEEEKLEYAQDTFLLSMSEFGQGAVSKFVKNWTPHIVENPLSFITTERMITASHLLTSYLPPDIDAVVGVPRSGLIPASFLACHYHVPLYSVSEEGVIDCGHGTRYTDKNAPKPDKVLLVDDTVFAGRTIRKVLPTVREAFPKSHIIKATVYATPQAKHIVDYFACELAEPHYLEWNIFNGWPGQSAIYDMDGILCRDIAPEDDDDGERYLYALKNASPRFLPRRRPIAMIVTARLERYRAITLKWLESHRIKVDKLVMGPWRTLTERNRPMAVSKFKAKTYLSTQHELFIESCPIQAKEIAKLTGRRVLCPDAGRVFT